MSTPLAERLRPHTLDDFIGQEHLIGKNGALLKTLKNNLIPSLIFWGPPGVGKTTLANIIAKQLERPFYTLSAINSGVKDVREVINKAKSLGLFGQNVPILFIDEIHRFSKSQQDSLLNAVEKGIVTLVGATTENPSFEVIPALLSRCQVYVLEHFNKNHLLQLLEKAINTDKQFKQKNIQLKESDALFRISGGDGRKLLNIFELVVNSQTSKEIIITNELVLQSAQENIALYDKNGEQHYDIISAYIKSVRGSDPNAAVYWLARMLEGGEDIKFIARRLIILASEDIGNANPSALIMANNCFQAITNVGMPESRIILSQTTIYLACSPKSNASYLAINKAQELVNEKGSLSVPLELRNSPTKLMKDLDYGKNYLYAHDFENNFVNLEFLPDDISGTTLYSPGNNERELKFKNYLSSIWKDKYHY
ncbi:MAG: replication-associated recombination protein A [Bacteroidota bacterium]|nr:replication-associated recombination protein A [Bacteroidota bacterium]